MSEFVDRPLNTKPLVVHEMAFRDSQNRGNRVPKRHATEVARDLGKLSDFLPQFSDLIQEACSELNRQAAVIAEVKAAFRT